MPRRPCSFPGCDKPHRAVGLCDAHRNQQRRGERLRPLRPDTFALNVVMGTRIDKFKASRLEAAALAYANAETEGEFQAARTALLAAALTLKWSRRASPQAHPSPAQGPEGVLAAVPGPSSAQEAA